MDPSRIPYVRAKYMPKGKRCLGEKMERSIVMTEDIIETDRRTELLLL